MPHPQVWTWWDIAHPRSQVVRSKVGLHAPLARLSSSPLCSGLRVSGGLLSSDPTLTSQQAPPPRGCSRGVCPDVSGTHCDRWPPGRSEPPSRRTPTPSLSPASPLIPGLSRTCWWAVLGRVCARVCVCLSVGGGGHGPCHVHSTKTRLGGGAGGGGMSLSRKWKIEPEQDLALH